jgi:hypothetical protein
VSVLATLPWQSPLETWQDKNVRLLNVKSGLSRHVVRFVHANGHQFAIKETSEESSKRELENYIRLAQLGIPTLAPVGVVIRNDGAEIISTRIGQQRHERFTGYLVTELMEKVVPDSFLYKRAFTKENRERIWDAVIRLFVEMHSRGVYWGDASLANMLINFSKETVPHLGFRTSLKAVLADAETVEIHPSLTDSLRLADVEFFLESMQWTEEDLRASGVVRDRVVTEDAQREFLEQYKERYAVEQEMKSFELVTNIDVDQLLGNFDVKGYGRILLKHINEHKWYLSERHKKEIALEMAAEDWYREVFQPVCNVFIQYHYSEYFPEKTAASLYVEIMARKYLMSEQAGKDVGVIAAARDYVKRNASLKPPPNTLRSILRDLASLLKHLPFPGQTIYH